MRMIMARLFLELRLSAVVNLRWLNNEEADWGRS